MHVYVIKALDELAVWVFIGKTSGGKNLKVIIVIFRWAYTQKKDLI